MFNKQQAFSAIDIPGCVQLLSNAVHEEEDCERVQATCDRVEEFLRNAKAELRDMVAIEMFECVSFSERGRNA